MRCFAVEYLGHGLDFIRDEKLLTLEEAKQEAYRWVSACSRC
jgi:hypothetical protein